MRADADFFCQPDERNEVSWIMFFSLGFYHISSWYPHVFVGLATSNIMSCSEHKDQQTEGKGQLR
jgi:hypothetical protein